MYITLSSHLSAQKFAFLFLPGPWLHLLSNESISLSLYFSIDHFCGSNSALFGDTHIQYFCKDTEVEFGVDFLHHLGNQSSSFLKSQAPPSPTHSEISR